MEMPSPYLSRIRIVPERLGDVSTYPFHLPFVRELDVELNSAVTFLVGENGAGKSTFIEAVAKLCGLPTAGGGKNELFARTGTLDEAALADALRPTFERRPRDSYFFRAEHMAHFAEMLEERREDPDFLGDPYGRYGGKPLMERSHGEAFLALMTTRLERGLFLMDEPESALSPQRQLSLLAVMAALVSGGDTQLIIATHSPILLTFPGARILAFDGHTITPTSLEETSHYQITRGILEAPERYWRALLPEDE